MWLPWEVRWLHNYCTGDYIVWQQHGMHFCNLKKKTIILTIFLLTSVLFTETPAPQPSIILTILLTIILTIFFCWHLFCSQKHQLLNPLLYWRFYWLLYWRFFCWHLFCSQKHQLLNPLKEHQGQHHEVPRDEYLILLYKNMPMMLLQINILLICIAIRLFGIPALPALYSRIVVPYRTMINRSLEIIVGFESKNI